MHLNEQLVREALIKGSYMSKEELDNAADEAKAARVKILDYLIGKNLTTKNLIGQALAEQSGIFFADLEKHPPPPERIRELPEHISDTYHAILFMKDEQTCIVATDQPTNKKLMPELEKTFPEHSVAIAYALPDDIDMALTRREESLETRFMKILQESKQAAPNLVEEILEDAFTYYASDVHFEPRETIVIVRFRIDGVLHDVGRIPKGYYDYILNRIKVMAKLRIDEHMSAQDGAIRYAHRDEHIDLRISIVPTVEGEKIEIRILSGHARDIQLHELGLSKPDEQKVMDAVHKPFGMVLVTGPTGSGKTTTLYAVMKMLNNPDINITTIEDPVEYKIHGINQIQVNTQTNLTFSKGLRSVVRQDPDVILVGEIRDRETAEIAVNASLTGHLLLSTFHANDSATALPRLIEMGIEPFVLSSTVELVIAQRLVRKICENCRVSQSVEREELSAKVPDSIVYFPQTPVTLYHGKGCQTCANTGYNNRIGIFELLEITPEMKELILRHPNARQVWYLAKMQGSRSMFEDGIEKVRNGFTTLEELIRVAPPPKPHAESQDDQDFMKQG
jgi:type II secretory ATPase GspE/PulE/Tfp pilus assembly ATPase PilB-like protein